MMVKGNNRDAGCRTPAGSSRRRGNDAVDYGREATPAQIASVLTALRMRGNRQPRSLPLRRSCGNTRSDPPRGQRDPVDTCGTGGDGVQTFNISTAAAFCRGRGRHPGRQAREPGHEQPVRVGRRPFRARGQPHRWPGSAGADRRRGRHRLPLRACLPPPRCAMLPWSARRSGAARSSTS